MKWFILVLQFLQAYIIYRGDGDIYTSIWVVFNTISFAYWVKYE